MNKRYRQGRAFHGFLEIVLMTFRHLRPRLQLTHSAQGDGDRELSMPQIKWACSVSFETKVTPVPLAGNGDLLRIGFDRFVNSSECC